MSNKMAIELWFVFGRREDGRGEKVGEWLWRTFEGVIQIGKKIKGSFSKKRARNEGRLVLFIFSVENSMGSIVCTAGQPRERSSTIVSMGILWGITM